MTRLALVGVQVMTYLLAQKLVCPHKFILLRGNHETRTQNSFPDYRCPWGGLPTAVRTGVGPATVRTSA